MTLSKETLMAFVDGELDAEDARRVETAIAEDPALAAYVEEQKALRSHLDRVFVEAITAPVPAHLERMILETPIAQRASARAQSGWFARLTGGKPLAWTLIPAGALAAGIAIGLVVGNAGGEGPIGNRNGVLVAETGLAQALSTQLASEQTEAATTRIGVSFRTKGGDYCRSFTSNAGGSAALAGIACRSANDWRIAALETVPAANAVTFQPAAASMPEGVRSAITGMIAGAPLDATAERQARDRGWSAP
jgi:hypothetical protein